MPKGKEQARPTDAELREGERHAAADAVRYAIQHLEGIDAMCLDPETHEYGLYAGALSSLSVLAERLPENAPRDR